MNTKSIEGRVSEVTIPTSFDFEFLYSVLLAYGKPQPSITRLKKGTYNLAEDKTHEIYWKNVVLFRYVDHHDLHVTIDDLKRSPYGQKHTPRFIIVTDFDQLLAVDTKTEDTLEIPLKDFAKHYAFFLPWAGMEKSQIITENEADVKAAERMAKLYDEIIAIDENITDDAVFYHNLNVFFSRLLFCFFAEDTEIFNQSQFTRAISDYTQHDGSDLDTFLDELFQALDEKEHDQYPAHIAAFPYVNGGLFRNHIPAPKFNRKARDLIIKCGELNWSDINPDIFGSMIQAVVHPGQRAGLGMHYTSVVNIMKVIEPLFLEELKEELDKAEGDDQKLGKLLHRIYDIKVFDPACGSGNFLIISFKELRKIEHAILEQIIEINGRKYAGSNTIQIASGLKLENFYGIEIDDFAREVAVLSLWLAKHQMNIEFKKKFGKDIPLIPLKDTGNIIHENAARVDWNEVFAPNDEDELYIIGNPPYLGGKLQDAEQKQDTKLVLGKFEKYLNLDYIAIWFVKAAKYAKKNTKFAFVTTNSIFQGTQVPDLWPNILSSELEIFFAHKNFKWTNNARRNAGVICSIVGFRYPSSQPKYIFENGLRLVATNINAYLVNGADLIVARRSEPISAFPYMFAGNTLYDDGQLILSAEEKRVLADEYPSVERIIRRLTGSKEFINGIDRYCLWIEDEDLSYALSIPEIASRIENVRQFRLTGGKTAQSCADRPHQFCLRRVAKKSIIVVPAVSSERREYIPMGFVGADTIITHLAYGIYDAEPFMFGVLSTKMHMAWMKLLAGRLKSDYRYSTGVNYNTFPFPTISEEQKRIITNNAFEILDVRERYPDRTLSELYDPNKMPADLKRAHDDLDKVIERCYRVRPFDNDEDRLSHLFKLYEIMTATQKELFHA